MSAQLRLTVIILAAAALLGFIWWSSGFWTFLVMTIIGPAIALVGLMVSLRKRNKPPSA